ncbi:MAG: molybdopterin cofactor-binding domain-containing protein [Thermomicrobiales bacterium]
MTGLPVSPDRSPSSKSIPIPAGTHHQLLTIQDVGKALNPAAVEGQILGGTVQAMGFGLFESMVYGDDGQLISETMMDYGIPKADQVPSMETIMIEIPSRSGPFGAKGVGEPPIVPGAAAIANAVAAATGSASPRCR